MLTRTLCLKEQRAVACPGLVVPISSCTSYCIITHAVCMFDEKFTPQNPSS